MMQNTLSLRRLNEKCPALFLGAGSPTVSFAEFGGQLANELRFLEAGQVNGVTFSGVLPLGFLLLFSPEGRERLLAGALTPRDWDHAGAVRMAELLSGGRFPVVPERFEAALREWPGLTGRLSSSGMFRWTADVLAGRTGDREGVTVPGQFHHAELTCFLGRGSTSAVYGGFFRGIPCAIKVPVPGAEDRFRKELECLKMFSGERFFPELYSFSEGEELWSIITRCRTGVCALRADPAAGFLTALEALHRRGLRHGDLRRSNLGIREDGEPVLLDFSHVSPLPPGDPAGIDENEILQRIVRKEGKKHERDLLPLHVSGTGQTVA